MIYLQEDDLKTDAQERFILDSTADNEDSIDKIEEKVVAYVINYMSDRYDTDLIFNPDAPIRNQVLVDIISKITLYNIFRRNPARKVSTDTKEDWEWAMKELGKINSGTLNLKDLPVPGPAKPEPNSDSLWGNNSNNDFYI